MATLALAADTASHHHHLMTFDPGEPRLHDLHSNTTIQHHSTLPVVVCVCFGRQCGSVLVTAAWGLYTLNHKKREILFLTITLANLNRFLYFLYRFNRFNHE